MELTRAREKVWIDPDQILWCEAAGSEAKLHFDRWLGSHRRSKYVYGSRGTPGGRQTLPHRLLRSHEEGVYEWP
jgi:hypothetical protein